MKRVIDTSEVLSTVETPLLLFAKVSGAQISVQLYDQPRCILIILRRGGGAHLTNTMRLSADWLPKSETVSEGVGPDETVEMARDIFHRWVRKVKEAIPASSLPPYRSP